MSRLAERYWASLTDFRPEALDHLIEHGRRRDLPLWRRYLASLLDVEVIGQQAVETEDLDQQMVVRDAPTSTAYYTLDSTVYVGAEAAIRRKGRPLLAFVVVAALVVAASVSAWLLTSAFERYGTPSGPASRAPTGQATGTSDPTAYGTPSAAASLAPTGQATGTSRTPSLPSGTHQEAGGFGWATPTGWRRDLKTVAEVHYTSPDGTQELVGKSAIARGDLMQTWEASERNARKKQDYQKIRLDRTTFRGYPAVVWEYTFTLKGVPWHARLLGFDEGGKAYQINTWYQPGVETQALKTYDKVKNSFSVL
jgi:hypothetical protein